ILGLVRTPPQNPLARLALVHSPVSIQFAEPPPCSLSPRIVCLSHVARRDDRPFDHIEHVHHILFVEFLDEAAFSIHLSPRFVGAAFFFFFSHTRSYTTHERKPFGGNL